MTKVYLVGAGPGDPDLLTVKAQRLLRQADVVVYDRLVSRDVLNMVPVGTERIFVGKRRCHHHFSQKQINALLVDLAHYNRCVVRLKGGDPYIFGRGGEEADYLLNHGIDIEVVPGVTAASTAAFAGIPLTCRGFSNGVTLVTGHMREDQPLSLNWEALANTGTTLVLYMGLHHLPEIARHLQSAGMSGDMPAALIENGSLPQQRHYITQLDRLADVALEQDLKPPTLIVIGRVVELAGVLRNWQSLPLPEPRQVVYA
jgi:uroporphyrin-III C-methyltransferase/precorrin-2 dehydrogenase/sirohydrochlorin ferrochelatase/uroporphyrin-III C-methyltransferase